MMRGGVARRAMGFPNSYVLDYENVVKDAVIGRNFATKLSGGATPVPCIRCQRRVSSRLLETAKDLDADAWPTGTTSQPQDAAPTGPSFIVAAECQRDQLFCSPTRPNARTIALSPGHLLQERRQSACREIGLSVATNRGQPGYLLCPQMADYASVIASCARSGNQRRDIVDDEGTLVLARCGVELISPVEAENARS